LTATRKRQRTNDDIIACRGKKIDDDIIFVQGKKHVEELFSKRE